MGVLDIIRRVILMMFPIGWFVSYYLYEHKHIEVAGNVLGLLTSVFFMAGLINSVVQAIS